MKATVFFALFCLALAGCGDKGLSGTYVAKGGGLGNGIVMDKLDFASADSVDITMMAQTVRGTYKLDGKKLVINLNGQQQVFSVDGDGCLDGGSLFGKFCKA